MSEDTAVRDIVPGKMRCAKCTFVLNRINLNVNVGTVTAGDSKTEPCPNGCGPLWPITWEQEARQAWKDAEHFVDRAIAAEAVIKQVRPVLQDCLTALGPCDHEVGICNCDMKRGVEACDRIVDPAAAAPSAVKMGPFRLSDERASAVEDTCFRHDVLLRIDGDFENAVDRINYAEEVVSRLNAGALMKP